MLSRRSLFAVLAPEHRATLSQRRALRGGGGCGSAAWASDNTDTASTSRIIWHRPSCLSASRDRLRHPRRSSRRLPVVGLRGQDQTLSSRTRERCAGALAHRTSHWYGGAFRSLRGRAGAQARRSPFCRRSNFRRPTGAREKKWACAMVTSCFPVGSARILVTVAGVTERALADRVVERLSLRVEVQETRTLRLDAGRECFEDPAPRAIWFRRQDHRWELAVRRRNGGREPAADRSRDGQNLGRGSPELGSDHPLNRRAGPARWTPLAPRVRRRGRRCRSDPAWQ